MDGPLESPLARAIAALDALHAEDPARVVNGGVEVGEELLYARRMSAALARLVPEPSDALAIAVRAQHLCRWRLPRARYPEGKAGYHAWRRAQAREHAELASTALRAAGVDEATIERVAALIQKKDLARDVEAQALEDAACLVFIEHHLEEFAAGRDEAQLIDILRKTWRKMSARGRELALELPLAEPVRALVARALA